jgi:hypothetical protein
MMWVEFIKVAAKRKNRIGISFWALSICTPILSKFSLHSKKSKIYKDATYSTSFPWSSCGELVLRGMLRQLDEEQPRAERNFVEGNLPQNFGGFPTNFATGIPPGGKICPLRGLRGRKATPTNSPSTDLPFALTYYFIQTKTLYFKLFPTYQMLLL